VLKETKTAKPALSTTTAERERLMMPENCKENNDRDWDAKKPKQHASTKAHVTLLVSSIEDVLPAKSSIERNSYVLHWLVLGTKTVNHDQHNQAMGRPRALDWAEAGLVEADAHPYFCGDQISERETGRTVGPSASSRGGSARIPSIITAPHSRGAFHCFRHVSSWRFGPSGSSGSVGVLDGTSSRRTRCPRLYSELNRDRKKNVRTTFVRVSGRRECALCECAVSAEFYSLPGHGNASGEHGPVQRQTLEHPRSIMVKSARRPVTAGWFYERLQLYTRGWALELCRERPTPAPEVSLEEFVPHRSCFEAATQ
jgi:hypothetical protein